MTTGRAAGDRLHPLTISSLYPSAARPEFGIFVENRLRQLAQSGEIVPRVLAPVPWVPAGIGLARYADLARTPRAAERYGVPIHHPRYPMIPKIGMSIQPILLYRALRAQVAGLLARGVRIDLVDAHYVYPDGVAAALLARDLDLPLILTARGTDLNLLPRFHVPRRWIRWAIRRADGLVAVCEALARVYRELGAPATRVRVLRNGVDLAQFQPMDRTAARQRLGVTGPCLLTVGQLIARKGVHLAIEALPQLPGTTLLVAGDGPLRRELETLAARLGVAERVRFLGQWAHTALPELYSAADALVLASEREGWPNVLLEAMACGTPVLATPVWGVPEIVTAPAAGRLLKDRTPAAVAAAWQDLMHAPPARAATRGHAERFGWEPTTRGQLTLFREVVAGRKRP